MAVLDLNTTQLETLDLTLQDADRTTLHVTTPTEALVAELEAFTPDMLTVIKTGNKEGVQSIYDLAARLISCNREGITITGEELLGKYRMTLESAVVFFSAYMDYITGITNQKN